MNTKPLNFIELAISEKLWSKERNLKNHLSYLFKDLDIEDKHVLDVGGGDGLLTFYAASQGAKKVICLEPEHDGSTKGVNAKFLRIKESYPEFRAAELRAVQLQDFRSEPFDIVTMSNVINHLDEEACIALAEDPTAAKAYNKIFRHIYSLMTPGGQLLITDCTRSNFYDRFGMVNPFMPDIEWHKHQSPRVWSRHLTAAGFENPKIRWTSFNTLGKVGRVILGNEIGAYFTLGHFLLRLSKPK